MGHSDEADKIRTEFLQLLKNNGVKTTNLKELSSRSDNDILQQIFTSWSRTNREIYFIKDVGFVNLHIRSESKGFWGITQSIEDDFKVLANDLGIPSWYVLLVGRDDKWLADGYIIDHAFSKPILSMPAPTKGQYKINEKSNLDTSSRIRSLEDVVATLVTKGKENKKKKEMNT